MPALLVWGFRVMAWQSQLLGPVMPQQDFRTCLSRCPNPLKNYFDSPYLLHCRALVTRQKAWHLILVYWHFRSSFLTKQEDIYNREHCRVGLHVFVNSRNISGWLPARWRLHNDLKMTLLPKQVTTIPWSGLYKLPLASSQMLASAPTSQLLLFQASSLNKKQVPFIGPCDN